jgi:hypothetical protein
MKIGWAALAALFVSVGAQANTSFNLGTISGTAPIGNLVSGRFTDTITFSLASASTWRVSDLNVAYDLSVPNLTLGKISGSGGDLDGTPLSLALSSTLISPGVYQELRTATISAMPLTAGLHTRKIVATAELNSRCPGSISMVPEPASYALMLAGLGALTWRLGRRRSTAAGQRSATLGLLAH